MNLFNIIDIKLVDRLIGGQTDRLTKNMGDKNRHTEMVDIRTDKNVDG